MNADKMEDVLDKAEGAFWASVASQYPEITTGDLNPMTANYLRDAMSDAVREWVAVNSRP